MSSSKKLDSDAAKRLARRGASKGGEARAAALSQARRSAIAAAGAAARWKRAPRIRVTFSGRRVPTWKLADGVHAVLLRTEIVHPRRAAWAGEVLALLAHALSHEPNHVELLPEAESWVDVEAMRALAHTYLYDFNARGTSTATYLIREDDSGRWCQDQGDVGAGARGEDA